MLGVVSQHSTVGVRCAARWVLHMAHGAAHYACEVVDGDRVRLDRHRAGNQKDMLRFFAGPSW
jgi:hypothetical protein